MRKKLCIGYIASKREAERHTRKVLKRIDAENQKLDQMGLFDEQRIGKAKAQ